MAKPLPITTDTVIVGNGPSALILSFILHGNIPQYIASPPHPDPLLHGKLVERPDLLHLDITRLTEHFEASQISYSTQALPVNVLLDTLVRPNGDTCDLEKATSVAWKQQLERAIPHIVIGNTASPGGQWVDNPVQASWDIGTLSYAGMLSLPGYSFAEHYRRTSGKELPAFTRPSRRQVTEYFKSYPRRVRIDDAIHSGETVSGITRTEEGFHIRSHGIRCKHLVLASGVFSELIPVGPLLQPLLHLPSPSAQPCSKDIPLLVVGSGFSAADVITSSPPSQKIVHIYKWAPSTSPSPLRACHQQAYPEYAGVYRRMKQAAAATTNETSRLPAPSRPKTRRASASTFDLSRDWTSKYEGFPNTTITDVKIEDESALVTLLQQPQASSNINAGPRIFHRRISRLEYVVGRRGSLAYLSRELRREVCGVSSSIHSDSNRDDDHESDSAAGSMLSGQTLREKVLEDIELAPNVFAIGSLTGDSLIRFAYGSCVFAAGRIMAPIDQVEGVLALDGCVVERGGGGGGGGGGEDGERDRAADACQSQARCGWIGLAGRKVMNGLEGHYGRASNRDSRCAAGEPLDRRRKNLN